MGRGRYSVVASVFVGHPGLESTPELGLSRVLVDRRVLEAEHDIAETILGSRKSLLHAWMTFSISPSWTPEVRLHSAVTNTGIGMEAELVKATEQRGARRIEVGAARYGNHVSPPNVVVATLTPTCH